MILNRHLSVDEAAARQARAQLEARQAELQGVLAGLAQDKRFGRMQAAQDELHQVQAELAALTHQQGGAASGSLPAAWENSFPPSATASWA